MVISDRGCVSLVFDDGYTAIYSQVVPLLEHFGLPGVFAVTIDQDNIERSEGLPVTPWQTWLTLGQRGHEIAAHSVTHADLTQLAPKQLDDELRRPSALLNSTTLVYPGGAYNAEVLERARVYYRAARTVSRGFEHLPPKKPWQLKSYNFTGRNFTAIRANAFALNAWLTNRWLIETYHLISDGDLSNPHSVSLRAFTAHLRFLSRLPIAVLTIDQVLARSL